MPYEIIVESSFSAAHHLKGHKGKCETMHGHNWKIQVAFNSNKLNKIGLVLDFGEAKELLNKILDELDHKDISEIDFFKKNNPTSELIAKFIFIKLDNLIKSKATLKKVSVWETPTSCASYAK